MRRIRLGIYMEDVEYAERLGKFLMGHYTEQLELFVFTEREQLERAHSQQLDAMLLSDNEELLKYCCELTSMRDMVMISLAENRGNISDKSDQQIHFVDKYQDVNRIVDEIMRRVGNEVEEVMQTGTLGEKTGIYAIYSLAKNEYQFPFTVTTGAVFGEKKKTLILDLQENSGVSQLLDRNFDSGLEELMVMASLGRFSEKKIRKCIGHLNQVDLVYPVLNSENICEIEKGTYQKLLHMMTQEMGYQVIVVNLGSRFPGFFDFLDQCTAIYLLTGKGNPQRWREKEFFQELSEQGYPSLKDRITRMEIPTADQNVMSCEKLVEQWKWTDLGNRIRENSVLEG